MAHRLRCRSRRTHVLPALLRRRSNANKYPDATEEDFESVRQAVPLDIAFYNYVVKVRRAASGGAGRRRAASGGVRSQFAATLTHTHKWHTRASRRRALRERRSQHTTPPFPARLRAQVFEKRLKIFQDLRSMGSPIIRDNVEVVTNDIPFEWKGHRIM